MNYFSLSLPIGKLLRGTAVFLLPALLFLLLFQQMKAAPTAVQATITVNTTVDELNSDSDCSLREAIQSANTGSAVAGCAISGSGDYVISVPAGSYFLTVGSADEDANAAGDFDILVSMTIQGAGAGNTVLDANLLDRVFDIDPAQSNSITVTLASITIQNGRPPQGSNGGNIRNVDDVLTVQDSVVADGRLTGTEITNGGGIASGSGVSTQLGVLNIINSTIEDNSSTFGSGGGIYNDWGVVNVSNSVIVGNSAQVISGTSSGGGLSNIGGTVNILNSAILNNESDGHSGGVGNFFSAAVMNIANSTISGNRTNGSGGGIRNSGQMYLTNVTITNNTADFDAQFGGFGGGIRNQGVLHLKGSIIYGNIDNYSPDVINNGDEPLQPDIGDTTGLVSEGYNMLGIITGTTTITNGVNEDLVGVDPDLGSQTGSPPYFPLSVVSPALNRIPPVNCTFVSTGTNPLFGDGQPNLFDQVGNGRPDASIQRCDIGALEPPYSFIFVPFVSN
ncbi:MAG: CSLREA domain-containing protein [Anaerolineales bacterium]|nr:CSLREA domain-containing protein [Anaerolineales bacterium]